ncbi:MAG: AAA family ATPase [bacterium]|nr:AAA family ATPase [bacterium]
MYDTGLIVGKFYPPHKGHGYLIETALSRVKKLTIIVCGKKKEDKIDPDLRGAWLRELYPKAQVMVIEDTLDQDDSKAWAEASIAWLGYKPDVVFTSEDYGDPWSRYLGSEHTQVDKERKTVPICATLIRANPYKYWQFLEDPVRAYFAKRVCLVGAESTGKSTLSKDLAKHYKTTWVPEFGRYHWEARLTKGEDFIWSEKDFIRIANFQNEWEDELAKEANRVLICDTNSFATGIWFERYMEEKSEKVEKSAEGRKYDLYIVTDVDVPFEDDGTRDGEHIREWMHKRFIQDLKKRKEKYVVVSGSEKERIKKAVREIDKLFDVVYLDKGNG